VYSLGSYLAMLSDQARVAAYAGAIRALVKTGDRVIELGAGFGYFSVLAAQAGAARVDAVELNPVVHLGPRIAAASGLADRIRFHEADVRQFEPDARADVLLGDLRGPTPFSGRAIETLIDARRRMLKEGGIMIGRRDVLYCEPSRRPRAFEERITAPLSRLGVDLSAVAAVASATLFPSSIAADRLFAPGAPWGEIDYLTVESPNHRGAAEWTLQDGGDVAGIAIWFEGELGAGFGFSAAPGMPVSTYGQLFVPFKSVVAVAPSEVLRVELSVHLVNGEYVWVWTVRVRSAGGTERLVLSENSMAERVVDPAAFRNAL
jgi:SAM-dependent methyltransferase